LEKQITKTNNQIYKLRLESKKMLNITEENNKRHEKALNEKIDEKQKLIEKLEENIIDLYNDKKHELLLDKYIKIGQDPDSIVYLPITDKENTNLSILHEGLNLENMLKKMRDILEEATKFNLHKKNCSSTVLTILNSGINTEDQKTIGKNVPEVKDYQDTSDPFFKMLTPQSVYNAASSMDEKFMQQQGITTKEKNIKKAIKKLQISRKSISIKLFTRLLTKIKEYFVNKRTLDKTQQLKSSVKNASLLFSIPKRKTKLYKKDAKTEDTMPLLPKRSSRS